MTEPTINQILQNLANDYIGYKVGVHKETHEHEFSYGKKSYDVLVFDVDDLREELDHLDINYRLKMSGHVYTQDYRLDRFNFRIDDDGTILDVYLG